MLGSAAYHSQIMTPAVLKFRKKLRELVDLRDPMIAVHTTVDGSYYRSTAHIRKNLPNQINHPVKWQQLMHILYEREKGSAFPWTYIVGPQNYLKEYLAGVNRRASKYCINVTDREPELTEEEEEA